jgi:hydrogenase expression/formation protein HypD
MVCFVAGFETLLAPLAGMILEGVPDNLTFLLSGRRADPLVARLLEQQDLPIDGLILPGNRCSLTGTGEWESLVQRNGIPAAVAGYTVSGVLAAILAVLQQAHGGAAYVDNCYRPLVKPDGNPLARDKLFTVFDIGKGQWRGIGEIADSGFVLRPAYDSINAEHHYPDYRGAMPRDRVDMPKGCDCASVMTGRMGPSDCGLFAIRCTPMLPVGPCMASEDGPCFLQRNNRNLA